MQQDKEKVSPLLLAEFSPSRPPFNPSVASACLCVPPSFSSRVSPLVVHLTPLPRRSSCLRFAFPYPVRHADQCLSYLR